MGTSSSYRTLWPTELHSSNPSQSHLHKPYLICDVLLKPSILLKVTLFRWCFSRFLNCTNGTKSRKASHIALVIKASLRVGNRTQYTNHQMNNAVENQFYQRKSQYISFDRLFYTIEWNDSVHCHHGLYSH